VIQNMAKMGESGIDYAIGVMLVILVGAATLPTAFGDWFNTTTSGWGSGTAALWPLVPLFGVIGLVYFFYRKAM